MKRPLLALLLALVPSRANAVPEPSDGAPGSKAENPAVAPLRTTPDRDWRAFGYLGGYGALSGEVGGNSTVGGAFQYRGGPFVAGALLELSGMPYTYMSLGGALLAGIGVRPLVSLRLELLGVLGFRAYAASGSDIGEADPGANATTGYAGGRAGISWIFGKRNSHFELGTYVQLDDDLSRQRVRYSHEAPNEPITIPVEHVVGMTRLGLGIELGATHDIF